MLKSVELCQLVSRAINHTTWNIPRVRDGDRLSASTRDNIFTRRQKHPLDTFPSSDKATTTMAIH